VQDISLTDVKDFIAKRQVEGAANGSINREVSALKRGFNLAIQAERPGRFEPKQFLFRCRQRVVETPYILCIEFGACLAAKNSRPTWRLFGGNW